MGSFAAFMPAFGTSCRVSEVRFAPNATVPPGGMMIGLHEDPERARALTGFVVLGLRVRDLGVWVEFLDQLRVPHGPGPPSEGHLGWYIRLADPDGVLVELHTPGQPSADEA